MASVSVKLPTARVPPFRLTTLFSAVLPSELFSSKSPAMLRIALPEIFTNELGTRVVLPKLNDGALTLALPSKVNVETDG